MDLRGGLALALFTGGMTIFYALGLFLLLQFFGTHLDVHRVELQRMIEDPRAARGAR